MLANQNPKEINKRINMSSYKIEIELLKSICFIGSININSLIFMSNEFDKTRKEFINKFAVITKQNCFWEKLENKLDLLIINRINLKENKTYYTDILKILKNLFEEIYVNGTIDEQTYISNINLLEKFTSKKR